MHKKIKLPVPSGFTSLFTESFFELSLMGSFVCTEAELSFFFDEKRSASISSMSCAKINTEQKFGPRTDRYRGECWGWISSRECRTFIFFNMSLGSAAETSES